MTHIFPVFTTIITEAEMGILLVLMRIVLERHNLIWLASCRVGLVLLTMILSRAEMVKQNVAATFTGEEGEGDGQGVSDAESSMWEEIYSFLFSSFQGQFAELFKTDTLPDDQVYVWQFLSAMAVGASGIEQQKILVTEMRYFFFIWFSFL
jgi:DNA topoisomerase 2-associated protein PAT1